MSSDKIQEGVNAVLRNPTTTEVHTKRIGRNESCPCGSGEKFKKCCLWKVNCGVEIIE
jgi:uncharacterized protein YecA (UPF0149 family)